MARRFIAGARCPECGLQDKIVVDSEAGLRECVHCGFSEARPLDAPAEPQTRVTRPAARRLDSKAEPVTLVDPAAPPQRRRDD